MTPGNLPRSFFKCTLVLALSLVFLELGLRGLIFSNWSFAKGLRDPANYFNYFADDDFWNLNYFTGEKYGKSRYGDPAPLLGWGSPHFDPATFRHREADRLKGRRPVLLYGDSFARCTTDKCFQDYFNADSRLAKKCYLLNYASGAHGIDQTYLVFHHSIAQYRKPLVVYSVMTDDLDRASLRVFTRPKPYFKIEGDQLVLQGVPVPKVADYFEAHRPRVSSYLYLLLSRKWKQENAFTSSPEHVAYVQDLSRRIFTQAIQELRKQDADFIFLVFSPKSDIGLSDEEDWRLSTVVSVLKANHVRYVLTKDLLKPVLKAGQSELAALFRSDGHPNDQQNKMIYEALKRELHACD